MAAGSSHEAEITPVSHDQEPRAVIEAQTSYGTINKVPAVTDEETTDTEQQPLLDQSSQANENGMGNKKIATVISILMFGEFIASADATLIYTGGSTIASEFNRLDDLSWLSTATVIGTCATQSTLGKLSDIYGRKSILLWSYFFYALGRVISGFSNQMGQVILGRAVSGVGGAGMMTMGSVIITDIVPRRDLATWRAYVNLAMTLGRSLGGPIGGWQTDQLGWRWLFLSQVPLIVIATILVIAKLELPSTETLKDAPKVSVQSKFRRIDFLGAITLAVSITTGMVLIDMGGHRIPWTSYSGVMLSSISIITFILFIITEAYIAADPIFSFRLLKVKDVLLSYAVMCLQTNSQVIMMFFVPLYFQVTENVSNTEAGLHLVPAVVGNAVGGLIAGFSIHRTGRFKFLAVGSCIIASISYVLLLALWRGHTNWLESMYIIPGGLGTGMIQSVAFVGMAAALEPKDMAMATSGFFLILNVGMVSGVTGANSALKTGFRNAMLRRIHGPKADEIIHKALTDVSFIAGLTGKLRETVISCYVSGLQHAYIISVVGSLLAFTASLFLTNRKL